jgi:hypothetical protein
MPILSSKYVVKSYSLPIPPAYYDHLSYLFLNLELTKMAIGRIIVRLIGVVAVCGATPAAADDYEIVYSKGDLGPSLEKCLSETFKKRSTSERAAETVSFFTKIYNITYRTHVFSQVSAFRHIEITDGNRSPLIITIAVLRDAKGLPVDDRGHSLASIAPMEAISYIDGRSVYHGQVESRKLDDKDRVTFKTTVDCTRRSESR